MIGNSVRKELKKNEKYSFHSFLTTSSPLHSLFDHPNFMMNFLLFYKVEGEMSARSRYETSSYVINISGALSIYWCKKAVACIRI